MLNDYAVAEPPKVPRAYRDLFDMAKHDDFIVGDLQVKVHQWEGKHPVLCVHGSNGNAAQFGKLIRSLHCQGRGVLAVDIPSHDPYGRFIPSNNIGLSLVALQERFGEVHSIIAHSMACSWALWAVCHGLDVEKIVCLSPAASQEYVFKRFRMLQPEQTISLLELEVAIENSFGPDWRTVYSTEILCRHVHAQALIFHDRSDQVIEFDYGGSALAAQWPGSIFMETTGLGHAGMFRADEIVQHINQFVSS